MCFQKEIRACFVIFNVFMHLFIFVFYIEEWGFIAPGTRESEKGNTEEWKAAEPAAAHMPVTQSLSGIQS